MTRVIVQSDGSVQEVAEPVMPPLLFIGIGFAIIWFIANYDLKKAKK